jgi:thiamine-monophosphate kinase
MKKRLNEDTLLRKIEEASRGLHGGGVRLGIGDDAAIWKPTRGYEAVLTCDWSLEGSHFLLEKHPADAIGWKSLARATSDIAAMGATARCYLLSLALPTELTGRWLTNFLNGLGRASRKFGCVAAGGDTTRRKETFISITVVGEVRPGRAILRAGAKAGDALFVSGTLGEADLGLRELVAGRGMGRVTNAALRKHMYPEPRLELGRWLAEKKLATAMMDVSDGLSTDLRRLCAASGVGARVEAEALPRVELRDRADAVKLALHGGDDYELLFCVRKKDVGRVPGAVGGVRLTRVGEMVAGGWIVVVEDGRERALDAGGWDPFRE